METAFHLTAKGVELLPEEESQVQEAVAELERFFPRLVGCRAVVSVPHRRPRGSPVAWTVRLSLTVPGGELVVTRQAKPSFREALDQSIAAARRKLQDYARELRGDVKPRTGEQGGWISRLFGYEGYGFITADDGSEIYFHRNSVLGDGFDRLAPGMEVRYTESEGEEGPQAGSVVPTGLPASVRSGYGEVF
jgi:cold shock CspA family protein